MDDGWIVCVAFKTVTDGVDQVWMPEFRYEFNLSSITLDATPLSQFQVSNSNYTSIVKLAFVKLMEYTTYNILILSWIVLIKKDSLTKMITKFHICYI